MRLLLPLLLLSSIAVGNDNNTQEGSLNNNYDDSTVNSNNNTQSETNNYNGAGASSEIPVGTAMSPSYLSNGMENCLQGSSGALQTLNLGISKGSYVLDEHCNRRRDAKVLSDLGMKVAAVARMCENPDVWESMFISGTPCPILTRGKLVVGKRAYMVMKSNPELYIPNYGSVSKKKGFTEKQVWYNTILGIGEEDVKEETGDGMSISERFRTGDGT